MEYDLFNIVRGRVHGSNVSYAWSAEDAEAIASAQRQTGDPVEVNRLGTYPEVEATIRLNVFSKDKVSSLPGTILAIDEQVHETIVTISYHPQQHRDISRQIHSMNLAPVTSYSYFPPEPHDGYVSG